MIARSDTVLDEYQRPVPGALIYVYNIDGTAASLTSDGVTTLVQPIVTDEFGGYSYQANVGYYREDIWFGGKLRYQQNNIAIGSPGADLALRSDLAASGGSGLSGFLQAGTGAVARTVQDKLRDLPGAKDFGAKVDGVTDDATAITAAAATGKTFIVSNGTIITSAVPTAFSLVGLGATFAGSVSLDNPYPNFDPGAIQVIQKGNGLNCFIGIAHNNMPANTNVEPTGVTGYSRVDNGGNAGFGVFGRADLYATTGVATNELDSFNFGAAPNIANLPPNRAIGTTQSQPIALTVAAGGTFNSSIGIHICKEGSAPQQFLVGQYIASDAIVNYGIVVDAVSTSTQVPALLKHGVGAIGLQVQGVGTPVAANAFFQYVDGASAVKVAFKQDGSLHHQGSLSASGGVGYETGAGGAVTQATSKSTAVTLNKVCGQITMNGAALAANTIVSFTLTNSLIGADDDVRVWVKSGNASVGSYRVAAEGNASGSRSIVVENKTAGSLSEAIVLGFNVLKAVVA